MSYQTTHTWIELKSLLGKRRQYETYFYMIDTDIWKTKTLQTVDISIIARGSGGNTVN